MTMPRLEMRGGAIRTVHTCRECHTEYVDGGPGRCPDCLGGSE